MPSVCVCADKKKHVLNKKKSGFEEWIQLMSVCVLNAEEPVPASSYWKWLDLMKGQKGVCTRHSYIMLNISSVAQVLIFIAQNKQFSFEMINRHSLLNTTNLLCKCVCVCRPGMYQAFPDGLQLASRLVTGDSWGCGGNSVMATVSVHVVGAKTCCLFGLPS